MHKTSRISARVLTALSLLFSVGGILLRTFLLQNAYRVEDGFYTDPTLHAILRYGLIALAVLAFAWAHIYIKEGNRPIPSPEGRVFSILYAVVGCVLAGFLLYTFAKSILPFFVFPGLADLAMALFAAVAMLYYFTAGKKKDFRAPLCLCSALLFLAMIFGLYFSGKVSYVNHTVVLCFAAGIFMMLSIAAEGTSLRGRPAARRYLAYAPTAVTLCFTLSVPDLCFFLTDHHVVLTDIYYDLLFFVFGAYHLARLLWLAAAPAEEED